MTSPHRVWTDEQTLLVLDYLKVTDHLEAEHRSSDRHALGDSFLATVSGDGLLTRAAIGPSGSGVKIASIFPSNAGPSVQSIWNRSQTRAQELVSRLLDGVHLDLVGAYRPDMREADDAALNTSRIFVESRPTIDHEIGELAIPLAAGAISHGDVCGDLHELCQRTVAGRTFTSERYLIQERRRRSPRLHDRNLHCSSTRP